MSLSNLLLAVWLILVGLAWLTWVAVSSEFLGAWALVTGVVILLEALGTINYKVGGRP